MILSLVAAASENNVIGNAGKIPWHLPDDLRHFKEVTLGKPVIMGRKTYESIGRPLPSRSNIVISRKPGYTIDGCEVVQSLDEAMMLCENADIKEACIIGGGEIYKEAMPLADRIHFTRVHGEFEGDVFFPEITREWDLVSQERHEADDKHAMAFTFEEYKRRRRLL